MDRRVQSSLVVAALLCGVAPSTLAWAGGPVDTTAAAPSPSEVDAVVVTARRRSERLQDVPIPVSVVTGAQLAESGAYNVNRLKELVPSLQFYSSNPRNSAINIRGLGAPFGLTNDGLEQGVGFYVDGVYYARPASATLDFLDVERVEVLRGPQGTLYGKNTSAGAITITTRKPSFKPQTDVELSFGNIGFVQAKASITGPITDRLAARLSFSGTQRDGVLHNVRTGSDINDQNNLGVRGQLLFNASQALEVILAGDYTRQRPNGYAQVVAGVAPTLRPANRQFAQIISDLKYTPPSYNAFDRLTDADTPSRSNQDLGGVSLTANWNVGPGTLTSITAYRFWKWAPSSDRDFLGLPITTLSQATSKQTQVSQELRYAGELSRSLNFVVGGFYFDQEIDSDPTQVQEQGSAAARFLLAPSAAAATPGLLDGYGQNTYVQSTFKSAALFGQLEWRVTDKLKLLPGLRLNYDEKSVDYDNRIYGGLQTNNAALIALQRSILAPQKYSAGVDDTNVSGQFTAAYTISPRVNAYATYAKSFKSVGLNTAGVPSDAAGAAILSSATVKPEDIQHYEVGVKTTPFRGVTANLSVFDTQVKDFQAQVTNASIGVLRGYLANAKKVQVYGAEFDGRAQLGDHLSTYASIAYTDARYRDFRDATSRLELTGGPAAEDISGQVLPGVSKWAASFGGEYTTPGRVLQRGGDFFAATDVSYRSRYSSSATPSKYLYVEGYTVVNGRVGFRGDDGWGVYVWARNLFDENYFELLSAAPGGSGLYVGLPADPRTFGVTLTGKF